MKRRLLALGISMLMMLTSVYGAESGSEAKKKKPKLNRKSVVLTVNKKKTLSLKNVSKPKKVTWKSKKKSIVTVKKKGKKKAVLTARKPGSTKVQCKVKVGRKTYRLSCKVKVKSIDTSFPVSATEGNHGGQTTGTKEPSQSGNQTKPAGEVTPTPTGEATAAPTGEATAAPTGEATATPTGEATATPTQTATATPTQKATATPTQKATATPTAVPKPDTTNVLTGVALKGTSNDTVTGKVSEGTVSASFAGSSQYNQANFTMDNSISVKDVESISFKWEVTGTPDSACFKLLDTSGNEISKSTLYNKKTGTYTVTIDDADRDKAVGGFAIMTNSDIKDTTQTATVSLTELTFVTKQSGSSPTMKEDYKLDMSSLNWKNSSAYEKEWRGNTYDLGTALGSISASDYSKLLITVNLYDENNELIPASDTAKGDVYVKLSKAASDWGGFESIGGLHSGVEGSITLENYTGGPLILVVQNSNAAIKYIEIASIVLRDDGRPDATDVTTNYEAMKELAAKYGFMFGTNVSTSTMKSAEFRKLLKHHYNSITASNEMKGYSLLKQNLSQQNTNGMPGMDYTQADAIMDFAKENGIKVRGHVLVWDADMCDWFFREGYKSDGDYVGEATIKARVKYYIEAVMTHFEEKYPGVIYCWDVVNEAVGDSSGDYVAGDARHVRIKRGNATNLFYDRMGSHYVEESFLYAREAADKLKEKNPATNIKLMYNDYSTFYTDKRDAIIELVKSINTYKDDGKGGYVKLCDGIGMQSYIGGYGTQNGCMNRADIANVKTAIQKFAEQDVEVHVTELAVRNYSDEAEYVSDHAAYCGELFQTYVDINKEALDAGKSVPLTSISMWGLCDHPDLATTDYSYKMNGPFCGLLTEKFGVKDAFVNVYNVFKNN